MKTTNKDTVLALAMVSASVLNFEVLLTRYVALAHWHHLTVVIISIALLGFGIAGSVAALLTNVIESYYRPLVSVASIALVFSFPVAQILADRVPFNMLALPWSPVQYAYLLLYALCWLTPFLLAAFYISLTFMRWPNVIPRLYGADLLGAAFGAMLALFLLEQDRFSLALLLSPLLAWLAVLLTVKNRWLVFITGLTLLTFLAVSELDRLPKVNSFKEYSVRINEADARLVFRRDTGHSRLTVLASSGQHASPGQSMDSHFTAIPQWQLFEDGDGAIPLLLEADTKQGRALLTQSLLASPFQLLQDGADVLLLGTNPSWNSWTAYWHKANTITLLDPNENISTALNVLNTQTKTQRGAIIPHMTQLYLTLPRRFVAGTSDTFDLILASVGSNPVGNTAEKINFMMTQQGLTQLVNRLTENGILAIGNHISPVPKDNLRVLNTVITLLRQKGLDPQAHLAILRDWRTLMILVSARPLSPEQIARLSAWSHRWRFDLVALPGLTLEQSNRYHIRNDISYFDLAQRLTGKGRKEFVEQYMFDISPSTDNKPFLYHSLRWTKFKARKFEALKFEALQQSLSQHWPLLVGWGYLLSLASLILLSLVAFIFILLPLTFHRNFNKAPLSKKLPLLYFLGLGIGFMFIEIALLQQASLLLDSATSTFATILSAVLIGSGLGSVLLGNIAISARRLLAYMAGYALCFFGAFSMVNLFFEASLGWSEFYRMFAVFLIVTCLALPLGMLLPYGIRRLTDHQPHLIAWCWGINGFASVFGTLLAPLIALEIGFVGLLSLAMACYFVAGMANLVFERRC